MDKKDTDREKKNETVKNGEFVELEYTGYSNGKVFDSNVEEDVKKLNPDAKVKETIVVVGERMVVDGLDKNLEGKELGKKYEVDINQKDGFGERKRELVKTIPLSAFTEKKVNPVPGMVLTLDNYMVRIIAVSGARVVTDFNNPLAGKELHYKFKIIRKVENLDEKAKALFEALFKFVPKYEVGEKSIVVIGVKGLEVFVKEFNGKFKKLIGKDLEFKEEKKGLEEKVEVRDKNED